MSTSSRDPAAVFAGAIIGAAGGGAITSAVMAYFYTLRHTGEGFGRVAIAAGLGGLAASVLIALLIGRAGGGMRAAFAAVIALFGAFIFVILTTYADRMAGRGGLIGLAALCLAIVTVAWLLFLSPPSPGSSS